MGIGGFFLGLGRLITYGITFVSSFIVFILACVISAYINRHDAYLAYGEVKSAAGFLVFAGMWGMFVIGFLILLSIGGAIGGGLREVTKLKWEAIPLFLTWLFFVAGAGALNAGLGGVNGGFLNCGIYGGGTYTDGFGDTYTYGGDSSLESICRTFNALEAFAWIAFVFSFLGFAYLIIGGLLHHGSDPEIWHRELPPMTSMGGGPVVHSGNKSNAGIPMQNSANIGAGAGYPQNTFSSSAPAQHYEQPAVGADPYQTPKVEQPAV